MTTLEDDHAELENYPLSNWKPVKIIVSVLRSNFRFRTMSRTGINPNLSASSLVGHLL